MTASILFMAGNIPSRKTNYVILDEALDLVVSADPEIEFNHVGNQ